MKIIGIAGRKQSGKTVLSSIAVEKYEYTKLTYDNALKNLICHLLDIDRATMEIWKNDANKIVDFSFTEPQISYLSNLTQIKIENIQTEISKVVMYSTVREMLQKIGTDIIRKYNKNWHVNCIKNEILKLYNENNNVNIIIDDVRFHNEKDLIKTFGGEIYFIIKPNNWHISNHDSETGLFAYNFKKENTIINDTSLEHFSECWSHFMLTNEKRDIFYNPEKPYEGNSIAFNGIDENDDNGKTPYAAGVLCAMSGVIDKNTGVIEFVHGNKFIMDVVSSVLGVDEQNGLIKVYNPFIIENLKLWVSY